MTERDQDRDQEGRERDALCPDCGQGFKFYVDRLVGEQRMGRPVEPPPCPHCGCNECRLK